MSNSGLFRFKLNSNKEIFKVLEGKEKTFL